MSESERIEVIYRRDRNDDAWLVAMVADERAHTYGRTITEARRNICQVIELWLSLKENREIDHDRRYDLDEEFDLGAGESEVPAIRAERLDLAEREARLAEQTRSAARRLTQRGLSRRDTAEVLGISSQRVQQLVTDKDGRSEG